MPNYLVVRSSAGESVDGEAIREETRAATADRLATCRSVAAALGFAERPFFITVSGQLLIIS
ncbi:MAG: hypothetical protein EXS36_08065 [Pedosphaera sp.]|nr:hypothetical protein [Pedosphaera sp.]